MNKQSLDQPATPLDYVMTIFVPVVVAIILVTTIWMGVYRYHPENVTAKNLRVETSAR